MTNPSIYTVGGTVQAGGGIYVPRHADEELLELCRHRVFTYILTSRQMGKSSLMVRTAERLADEDIQSVVIDLTQLGVKLTAEQWYLGLLSIIEEALMLDTDVVKWWQSRNHLGFTQRLTKFFQEVLLVEVTSPVVIFVDEIDTTLSLDFTDDFFAAIRFLYVARAQDTKFERLSFVLIGVATPPDLIRDPKRTPFNIGQRLDLKDFSFSEALPLAEGLGLENEPAQKLLRWVLQWTGGHPYLTQRLCSVISEQDKESWSSVDVNQLVNNTFLGTMSKQDNNLQFVRDMLTKGAPNQDQVLNVYREIRLGRHPVLDEEQSIIKSHLKLSGVVRRSDNALVVRNRIYQEVFSTEWVEKELAQQRPYSQALMAWLETNTEDESRLLRGQALQDALNWSKGKSLGDVDYQFLAASQELDKREIQFALAETEKKAQQIVANAEGKAKRTTRMGLGILTVGIVGALGASWYAQKLINNAERFTVLEREGNNSLRLFEFDNYKIDALVSAMNAGQTLQKLLGKGVKKYPVSSPLIVLKEILYNINERNQLKGHTSSVYSARFSSDGKRILTASSDRTARIWDTTGKELAVLKGHSDIVYSARFSSDGKRILTASRDNTARIWRMEELSDLLARGCEWLNDYLVIHAQDLRKLKVCHTPAKLKAAAPYLVKTGEEEAKAGDVEDAIATFKTALKWNRELKFDSQKKAQALHLVNEGGKLVEEKKIKEAIAAYKQAQKIDTQVEIDVNAWGRLCVQGSLYEFAQEVMFACEKAVKLAPDSGYIRDSRGLARALTGDYKGAIADFEAYIAQTDNNEYKTQRQRWVKVLRSGKNPFTEEELKKLRSQ